MRRMTGEEFVNWRKKNGITIYMAGKLFGYSHKTVSAWNVGQNPVPRSFSIMVGIFDRNLEVFIGELKRAEDELEEEKAAVRKAA